MIRRKVLAALAAAGAAALFFVVTGFTHAQSAGTVYIGMDAPLTGPTELVGQSDRQTVQAVVAYWNAHGGIKGNKVVVDVLDNASNPSQAVQNVQKFVSDSKYVAILGSGNAAAAVATGPLAGQARIPFIALSPPTTLVEPPQPYVYVASPTARLFAYNEAAYLRKLKISRVWLMGDNGGFGRDGPAQVAKLAARYGLQVVDTTIFSPATTDFSADLTKIKSSNAQALWLWTATPAGSTIVKQFRQLQLPQQLVLTGANASPQFLSGNCPDANGAIVNSYLGTVWKSLKKSNQARAQGQLLQRMIRRDVSNFDVDTATALWALKAAMERGGTSRSAINTAIETKLRDLVTPGGRLKFSRVNHTGLQLDSMWAGKIQNCQLKPLFGAAFGAAK
jgi:branched-chain amino acid transport system substrate-binding protein